MCATAISLKGEGSDLNVMAWLHHSLLRTWTTSFPLKFFWAAVQYKMMQTNLAFGYLVKWILTHLGFIQMSWFDVYQFYLRLNQSRTQKHSLNINRKWSRFPFTVKVWFEGCNSILGKSMTMKRLWYLIVWQRSGQYFNVFGRNLVLIKAVFTWSKIK